MNNDLTLASLGWDDEWQHAFASLDAHDHLTPGRVVAEHRSQYLVRTPIGDRAAVLAGRLRHDAVDTTALPAVGDWVALSVSGDGTAVIHRVLPRRTALVRRAAGTDKRAQVLAANIDVVAVTTPLNDAANVRWLERFVSVAWDSGATPLIVLTKLDLCSEPGAAVAAAMAAAPGVDVVALSALTGAGLADLARHLPARRTLVLLGASGSGKSTLVNALLGQEHMATRAVRDDGKGRHTTTHRELIPVSNGALLIDTPGIRELGLWAGGDGLETTFADIEGLAAGCRFADCAHAGEPGCVVAAAVDTGTLSTERLAAWRKLQRELAHLAREADPRLASEHDARIRALMRSYYRFVEGRGR
jgi:ribosome biogenesis GTPase